MASIEERPSAPRFKHEPLPDSTIYIRLLEIQGIDSDGHLVCNLTAWPVEDAPDYYALSYTWGSPTPSHQILINGRVFTARQNCVYALKQARTPKASRYYWMDAICIDQSSTREKNHQVGMMSQIYARSKHVLVCVGSHTVDSTSLFRAIDKNRTLLAEIHQLALGSTIKKTDYWVMPNPIPRISGVADRCLSTINSPEQEALATNFIAFMNRPYFSRVWVLQELHLAPATSLCCGMDRRPFAFLLAVSILIDFWINASEQIDSSSNSVSTAAYARSPLPWFSHRQTSCLTLQESFHSIEAQRGCLTLATGFRGRRRLAEVLDAMQSFQCTDVRDRLFGILALIEWGGGEPAVPDYSKDNYQVAIEVLRLYCQDSKTKPTSGLAVEWPRLLCEVFQVDIEGPAIQQAITKKYGCHTMSKELSSTHGKLIEPKPIGDFNSSLGYGPESPSKIRFDCNRATWYENYLGHPYMTWRGVQLRDDTSPKKKTAMAAGLSMQYLYCSAHESIHGPKSESPYVEILDHTRRVFGYAPPETRPSDWLLFSDKGLLIDGSPMMVVMRSLDDDRREHAIIGQACKDRMYKDRIHTTLRWREIGLYWQSEDLFLFSCMHRNRLRYSDRTDLR